MSLVNSTQGFLTHFHPCKSSTSCTPNKPNTGPDAPTYIIIMLCLDYSYIYKCIRNGYYATFYILTETVFGMNMPLSINPPIPDIMYIIITLSHLKIL